MTEEGDSWTPIGHNDAITWPSLKGLYQNKDPESVRDYFFMLKEHGVTCLRLMMEYDGVYLENPAGVFDPMLVKMWDELFMLAEEFGIYFLLTPVDSFWLYRKWEAHPYNKLVEDKSMLLTHEETLSAVKNRFEFFIRRWGVSGSIFAWDLWNEIHPIYSEDKPEPIESYINEMSSFIRELEIKLYDKAHLQTVSIFGPLITHGFINTQGETVFVPIIANYIYRNPNLDFSSIHAYEENTIDHPKDTVAPARSLGRITKEAIMETLNLRPYMDSEHGPIHNFIDYEKTLPEDFDDEYFRHLQWAHFASGGVGGGMRWPNRHPHILTPGMHKAQKNLSEFLQYIDWNNFDRVNINEEIVADDSLECFGCASLDKALIWLLRKDIINKKSGRLRKNSIVKSYSVGIPMLTTGTYLVTLWNTEDGIIHQYEHTHASGNLELEVNIKKDLALAITKMS